MLQALSNKIKKFWTRLLDSLGGTPRRYWGYLLLIGFLLLGAVFVLDAFVFANMRDSAFGEVYLPSGIGVKSVDRAALSAAAQVVADRHKELEAVLIAPVPRDPGQ